MEADRKSLTSSLRADKLWSKLKVRAAEIQHGKLAVEFRIDGGHITGVDIVGRRETLIAE